MVSPSDPFTKGLGENPSFTFVSFFSVFRKECRFVVEDSPEDFVVRPTIAVCSGAKWSETPRGRGLRVCEDRQDPGKTEGLAVREDDRSPRLGRKDYLRKDYLRKGRDFPKGNHFVGGD